MYESFFELREKPFSLLPDPGFLFMSRQHQQALTLLEYGLMNQAGFIILTGEIGSGKTTLMRHLIGRLDPTFTVGLISNTHQSLGELMDWVCMAFDIRVEQPTKLEKYQAFIDFLVDTYAKGGRVLLIVDEAQNLGVEKLEELRLLSNINAGKDLVLQLMLLGQPQLRQLLTDPTLEQFAQRVTASYHIGPLDPTETESYIRHRIFVAGGTREIFTHDACMAVHHYSKGVPRLINLICDTALVYAYGADERVLTGASIDEFIASHTPSLMIPVELDRRSRPPLPEAKRESDDSGGDTAKSQVVGHRADVSPTASSAPAHSPLRHVAPKDRSSESGALLKQPSHEAAPPSQSAPKVSPQATRDHSTPPFGRPSPADRIRSVSERAGRAPSSDVPGQTMPGGGLGPGTGERVGPQSLPHSADRDTGGVLRPSEQSRTPAPPRPTPLRPSAVSAAPKPRRARRWVALASVLLILASLAAGSVWLTQFQDSSAFRAEVLALFDRLGGLAADLGKGLPMPSRSDGDAALAPGPSEETSLARDESTSRAREDLSGVAADAELASPPLIPPVADSAVARAAALLEDRASPGMAEVEIGRSGDGDTPPATAPRPPFPLETTTAVSETRDQRASPESGADQTSRFPSSNQEAALPPGSPGTETGSPQQATLEGRPSEPGASTDERMALTPPAERSDLSPDAPLTESGNRVPAARPGPAERDPSQSEPSDPGLLDDLQRQLSQFSLPLQRNSPQRLTADLGRFVRFDDGSVYLDSEAEAILSRIAAILKGLDPVQIAVIAHTDSSGPASVNQRLSARRAENVANHLISEGIPSERVAYEGKGSSELRVDAEEERLLGPWVNRRIELQLTSARASSEPSL